MMYLGASFAKKLKVAMVPPQLPKPIWKAVPTLRLRCPPTVESGHQMVKPEETIDVDSRLTLNQQIIIGRAENPPMRDRNNGPYLTLTLSWMFKRTIIPTTETSNSGRMKMYFLL